MPPVSLILADNNAYTQTGKIDMVDGQFDKNTGAITLRATFPNANGTLRSGNTGRIRLGIQHDDAILVPQSATIEMQDKVFVFTVDKQNKVTKAPITIIGKSGANYLIKDGVKSGDQIVLSGIDKLQEGQAIQPEKTTKIAQVINKNNFYENVQNIHTKAGTRNRNLHFIGDIRCTRTYKVTLTTVP